MAVSFALDPDVIHLNHGSFGAVPVPALEFQRELREQMEATPVLWFADLPGRLAAARLVIADYLRCPPDGLALVPNASAGISAVLQSLTGAGPGGVGAAGSSVLITDHAYGAAAMAVRRWAGRTGATVESVAVPLVADADEAFDAITARITSRTRLLVIDQITSATARLLPVDKICSYARRHGVWTLVDGAHAPGMLADPVTAEADFWVGNLHKWACGLRGTAALWARPERRDDLYPLIDSWGMAEPYPLRFDYQGTLDATPWLATPVALAALARPDGAYAGQARTDGARAGWDEIREHNRRLADLAQATIGDALSRRTGFDPSVDVGMACDSMRLLRLPDGIASTREQADALRGRIAREHAAEVAATSFAGIGYLRISAAVYTTERDLERFIDRVLPAIVE